MFSHARCRRNRYGCDPGEQVGCTRAANAAAGTPLSGRLSSFDALSRSLPCGAFLHYPDASPHPLALCFPLQLFRFQFHPSSSLQLLSHHFKSLATQPFSTSINLLCLRLQQYPQPPSSTRSICMRPAFSLALSSSAELRRLHLETAPHATETTRNQFIVSSQVIVMNRTRCCRSIIFNIIGRGGVIWIRR